MVWEASMMFQKSATRTVVVSNPTGLHARPSVAIASTVKKYQAKVEIRRGNQAVNAGDVLQLLTLGAPQGTELVLVAKGPDAEEVLNALEGLFADGFGM
jgi:phosphotransferase system HPr (HPr) family protein